MAALQTINLVELGRQQPVDTDYPLAEISQGALLLLNQRPQSYPWEQHKVVERIVVLDGEVGLVGADGQSARARVGEMIVVRPDYRHAYAEDSNGVVVVLFGA